MTFYAETIDDTIFVDTDDAESVNGVYLHGELEKENGFDLVWVAPNDVDRWDDHGMAWLKETIEKVDVYFADGSKHEAIAYIWESPFQYEKSEHDVVPRFSMASKMRGLICAVGDKKANEYALEKFNSRAAFI